MRLGHRHRGSAHPPHDLLPTAETERFHGSLAQMFEFEVVYPEAFNFLNGVRELSDGRVLAADPLGQVVLRFDLQSQVGEAAAVLWSPEVEQIRTPGHGFLPRLLEPRDDWAVGPDGRVAVVRAQGYSVAWHHPDGRVVTGPPNPLEAIPLDRETKEAFLPQMRSAGISMWSTSNRRGGEVRMGMSRGLSSDGPGVDDFQWAETLPPFRPDRTRVSPAGEAWVERWLPPDSTSRMDVFDQAGNLVGSIPLPPGRQLLGFGHGPTGNEVAYLVKVDEFDLMWLERYRVVRD